MTCDSVEVTARNYSDCPTAPGDLIFTPTNVPPIQATDPSGEILVGENEFDCL